MVDVLLYIVVFYLFALVQAFVINGIHSCFKGSTVGGKPEGMIFYMMAPKFFERHRGKFWAKVFTCVQCMAGWAGTLTFWAFVLPVFGFHPLEIIVWLFDIFTLVSLNMWVYKKL